MKVLSLCIPLLLFGGSGLGVELSPAQPQIDLQANIDALLNRSTGLLSKLFIGGDQSFEVAREYAAKVKGNAVDWVTSEDGLANLKTATPAVWPMASRGDGERLRVISLEYLIDGALVLALAKEPDSAASHWPLLPLANRESMCGLVLKQTAIFKNLGFHLRFDKDLTAHLIDKLLVRGDDMDSRTGDRFRGLKWLISLSSEENDKDLFVAYLVERLQNDPMNLNLLSIVAGSARDFPPNQRRVIDKELGKYLRGALFVLDAAKRGNHLYREQFKVNFQNSLNSLRTNPLLNEAATRE
jgi:hypothetical protein